MLHHLSDTLIRIKNAYGSCREKVKVVATRSVRTLMDKLRNNGLIRGFSDGIRYLTLNLPYDKYGAPIIKTLRLLSTPSRRKYLNLSEIRKLSYGSGFYFFSTNRGWLNHYECLKYGCGGMLVCYLGLT